MSILPWVSCAHIMLDSTKSKRWFGEALKVSTIQMHGLETLAAALPATPILGESGETDGKRGGESCRNWCVDIGCICSTYLPSQKTENLKIEDKILLICTLPKTDIAPEKLPSRNDSSLPTIHFQVLCQFQGEYIHLSLINRNCMRMQMPYRM